MKFRLRIYFAALCLIPLFSNLLGCNSFSPGTDRTNQDRMREQRRQIYMM